jgi:hypothetical protein
VIHTYRDPIIETPSSDTYCDANRFQLDFYQHIAVDIVTESVYNYPYPFISEKTLRPISCKRMFILVGAPNTLKLLHNKGFKTFGNVINESYDLEQDPIKRWHLVCKSIQQFVTQPIEEIQLIVKQHQAVLEHNYNTLVDLEKTELEHINDTNS